MTKNITYDTAVGQLVAFDGPLKIAVIGTHDNRGLMREGVPILEPIGRENWGIHFTSPSVSLEVLEALLTSLPKE